MIDLHGKFAMPSFVESHLHPLSTTYDRLFKGSFHDLNTVDRARNSLIVKKQRNWRQMGLRGIKD